MKKIYWIYILFLIIFLVLTSIQIYKPLMNEEVLFAYMIKNTADNFVPSLNEIGYGFEREHGFYHPPLYLYVGAFFLKIFGENLIAFKIQGIIFSILTSLVILKIANHLFPEKEGIGIFAACLYLIHPFVIQSSLFMDIDGGILTFFTTLSVYEFLKNKLTKPWLTGLILFIILWIKFTSFIILPTVFLLYLLLFERKEKVKKIWKIILICVSALVLFLLTFYILTYFVGAEFIQPFSQNTGRKIALLLKGDLFGNILRWGSIAKNLFMWVTPPLAIWLFLDLGGIALRTLKNKAKDYEKIFFIFIIISVIFFISSGINYTGWAKHFIVIMPFVCILLSRGAFNIFRKKENILKFVILAGIIGGYYLFIIKDPLFTPDIWMVFSQFNMGLIFKILFKIELIIFPFLIIAFIIKDIKKAFIFLTICFIVYSALFTSVANYSTNVNYGDYGLKELVAYMEKETGGREATIIAQNQFLYLWNKDDAYYKMHRNSYTYLVGYYYNYIEKYYDKMVKVPDNTYVIIYEHDIYRTKGFKEHLESNFDFIKQVGYYQIYKIRENN